MNDLLHSGIYSVPEASHLTGVSTWRIRRWLRGYGFRTRTGRHTSPPVWEGQLQPIAGSIALGFLDLIEVKCVNALLQTGVSWKTLRIAHGHAKRLTKNPHPFCTNRFASDGSAVFLQLSEKDGGTTVWDARELQRVFVEIIQPFLRNVEFSPTDVAIRWWPMGQDRQVVLDPLRSFGRPIVSQHAVPTATLASAVSIEHSIEVVAEWFAVTPEEVKDAVDYENKLAA